jgi:hypothetical protein
MPHDIFRITSPSDLVNNFYCTDHHWSDLGAYRGYVQLIHFLLGPDEPVLQPVNRIAFNQVQFEGSLARMEAFALDLQPDRLSMLLFDYPKMSIRVNGETQKEYGNLRTYLAGDESQEKGFDHYNYLYQKREAFIEIDTGRSDRGNILIVSDSMSNPVRQLIASHFQRTVFVNLERMSEDNLDFGLREYIADGNFEQVVFLLSSEKILLNGEMKYAWVDALRSLKFSLFTAAWSLPCRSGRCFCLAVSGGRRRTTHHIPDVSDEIARPPEFCGWPRTDPTWS